MIRGWGSRMHHNQIAYVFPCHKHPVVIELVHHVATSRTLSQQIMVSRSPGTCTSASVGMLTFEDQHPGIQVPPDSGAEQMKCACVQSQFNI